MSRTNEPKRLFLKFRRWDQKPARIVPQATEGEAGTLGVGSHVKLALGPHLVFVRVERQNDDGSFTGAVMLALRAPGYSAPSVAIGERLYFWKQNVLSYSPAGIVAEPDEPRSSD